MLNNKGFAVSTVLYTLLIAFLMFLGVALAQFSSSSSFIAHANDDLINGTTFKVMQVKPAIEGKTCGSDYQWYQTYNSSNEKVNSGTIVKITSKYGTIYWPKDFPKKVPAFLNTKLQIKDTVITIESGPVSSDNKISVTTTRNPNELNFDYNSSNDQIDEDGLFITIEDICKILVKK